MNESELLQKIAEVDIERRDVRALISSLKKDLLNAESDLIHCNLRKEGFVEQLRRVRLETVNHDITIREQDIERFRSIHPALLKKI